MGGAGRGPGRGGAGPAPMAARLLELQRSAGNQAVAGMVQTLQRESRVPIASGGGSTGGRRLVAAGGGSGEGGTEVGKVGLIDNDLKAGGGVNLRSVPSTEGNQPVGRLPHNQRVLIHSKHPGNWFRVVATSGAEGYVTGEHLRSEDDMPDPGSTLHRIQPNETAFDIVYRTYGVDAMKAGTDARFYSNVLVYANEDRQRHGIRRPTPAEKVQLIKALGPGKYLDAWTVGGSQIWVPSKEWADTLKGTVSSGSFARDTWEKIKDLGSRALEFLVKVPAFVGGLLVGAVESLVDAVKAVVDLVRSIVTGSIVDDVKSLMKMVSSKEARTEVLHSLGDQLEAKWDHPNPLKKWYWRGWLIGYVIGEVLGAILTAGAGAALKASKYGVKFAGFVKALKPVQYAMRAAAKVKATTPLVKAAELSAKLGTLKRGALDKLAKAGKSAFDWVFGRKGATTKAKVATAGAAAGDVLSVFHGTGQKGLGGIGGLGPGKINVRHTGGAHQDLGQGFYLATDRAAAEHYAKARGAGGMQHVMQWDIPVSKLGDVVDVRPGGNFAKQWGAFLDQPFAGGMVPGQPDYRTMLMRNADIRGEVFEQFLKSVGKSQADTVIAPLGVAPFTGIGSGTQVAIRSQAVADVLNAMIAGATK